MNEISTEAQGEHATRDMSCSFEIETYDPALSGTIRAYVVDNENDSNPANVIDVDAGGKIVVEWDIQGALKSHLCGAWCVTAYLESIGPGAEIAIPGSCECMESGCFNKGPWRKEFVIPTGIEVNSCGSLYQIGVTLTSKDCDGNPGHIAAFCKGTTVMFYKGSPDSP